MSASLCTEQEDERTFDDEDEKIDATTVVTEDICTTFEKNEEKQIDIDIALLIIQSEIQEFYSKENVSISNKALAQRKRVLENVLKSIGKNVLSSFVEEEEEKQLLLQNLISLLQVPKVKETEELLLATNDAVLAILMQANTTRNGKMTMDMDPSFLGFAFSSLLELASGTRKNTNYQKIRQSSLKVVLELVRFVKHKVSTLAFFLPGIVSALVKLLHSSKNEWIDDLATEQCLYLSLIHI